MKKLFRYIAIAAVAASTLAFTACGGTVVKTPTSPNWSARITQNDLNKTSEWLTQKEVATYSVKFNDGSNANYSVMYNDKNASYVTELYAVEYDWNGNVPTAYKNSDKELVYVYTTSLTISGKYVLGSQTKEFEDSVKTVSYFRSANDSLVPVYSKREVKNTSPAKMDPKTIDDAFIVLDRVYETYYNKACTEATVVAKYNANDKASQPFTEKVVKVDSTDLVFDASQIQMGLRALTQSGAQTVGVFIDASATQADYTASFGASYALDESKAEDKVIVDALNASTPDDYIFLGANSDGKVVYNYTPVAFTQVSNMQGSSNVYWYATVSDQSFNATRAVLLKIQTPVYFGLGSLTYTLSSLQKADI